MSRTAGRKGRVWRRLATEVRNRRGPCCRCGQRIDYTLLHPDPWSFSVDHYPYPLSTRPELAHDPGNLAAAHLVCNQAAGNGPPRPDLGGLSETW